MKIPFDIKFRPEIESGKYKVCDQSGKDARIICWDAKNKVRPQQCIIALVKEDSDSDDENNRWFDIDGRGADGYYRLFIITPEPELSEFEQEVRVCVTKNLTTHIKDGNGREMSSTVFIDDETAKKMAAELLELAKKEFCKDCCVNLDWYAKGRLDEIYKREKEGPAIQPYFPSCYHGGPCTNPMHDCINCPRQSTIGINTTTGTSTAKLEG